MLDKRYKAFDHLLVVLASLQDRDIESARTHLELAVKSEDLDEALTELDESQGQEGEEGEEDTADKVATASVVTNSRFSMRNRRNALRQLSGEFASSRDVTQFTKHWERATLDAEDEWDDGEQREREFLTPSELSSTRNLSHAKQVAKNLASLL